MFLSELRIWNFRKFGTKPVAGQDDQPGLVVFFNSGLNLLVGENDSGKTCIVDAIKLVLLTQSREYVRADYDDFYIPPGKSDEKDRATYMRIDCYLRGLRDEEAKDFLEWLGFEKDSEGNPAYYLKMSLRAKRKGENVYHEVRAGVDEEGAELSMDARDLLRTTYLKPLRDAESELMPGRRSRLAQILVSHQYFSQQGLDHTLVAIFKDANKSVRNFFEGLNNTGNGEIVDQSGKLLLKEINSYLEEFFTEGEKREARFAISDPELKSILEKLELKLLETKVGLGSLNRLFIAAELLLLKRGLYTGLRLALIEELEAHLHPQAQLRLIEYLQGEVAGRSNVQLIITSHSPNLASKVKLDNLIICKSQEAFSMGSSFTMLAKGDYSFLERFLDTTKANLFFAQGVILVEGDAENLIIPTVAKIIDRDLSKHGVSVVNIGSTAFLRYSRIFKRSNGTTGMAIPVACITDNDLRPAEYKLEVDSSIKSLEEYKLEELEAHKKAKMDSLNGQGVRTFVSPLWSLEYDICCGNLWELFYKAVLRARQIQNSDLIGLSPEKIAEVNTKAAEDSVQWKRAGWTSTRIAFEIYWRLIKNKRISKAIVAQCFAQLLKEEDKEAMKQAILKDEKWKYIVDAIEYVTGLQRTADVSNN